MNKIKYVFTSIIFIILAICLAIAFAADIFVMSIAIAFASALKLNRAVIWLADHIQEITEDINNMNDSLVYEAIEILSKK